MTSIVPGMQGVTLAVLARAQRPLTGRAVAAHVKSAASTSGVHKALLRLVEAGLVERTEVGSATSYTLNRDHVAAGAVLELADLRTAVVSRFTDTIARWPTRPKSATIFGSFARGDGGPESDIDVLLVRVLGPRRTPSAEQWHEHVADLVHAARRWTGNPVNVVELSPHGLKKRAAEGEQLIHNAAREGLTVFGTPLRRLLAGHA